MSTTGSAQEGKGDEVGMTINEWREDFESFINELNVPKDDYNGIMEYIYDGYVMLKERQKLIDEITRRRINNGEFD